jgi:hypothetical protein
MNLFSLPEINLNLLMFERILFLLLIYVLLISLHVLFLNLLKIIHLVLTSAAELQGWYAS